jgi:hypothetical protein
VGRTTTIDIPLPKGIKPSKREAIAHAIIDYMAERSKSDSDITGRSFPDYEEEYASRKGSSKVDLSLSNEMLDSMDYRHTSRNLRVGYSKGNSEQGKAEGNHYGTYGTPSPISGKARPFIGFVGKEREQLVSIIAVYGDVTKSKARSALKGAKIKP